jgi:hypothetical protein
MGIEPILPDRESGILAIGRTRHEDRALGRNRTDTRGLRSRSTTVVLQGRAGADDGDRTRLYFVGNEVPHRAASSANRAAGWIRTSICRVRTGASAIEIRGHREAKRFASIEPSVVTPRPHRVAGVPLGNRRFTHAAVGYSSGRERRTPISRVRFWCLAS